MNRIDSTVVPRASSESIKITPKGAAWSLSGSNGTDAVITRVMGSSPWTREALASLIRELQADKRVATKRESAEYGRAYFRWAFRKGYAEFVNSEVPESVDCEVPEEETPLTGETITRTWLEEQMRTQALDRKVATLLKRRFTESYEDLLSFVGLCFAKWGHAGTCDKFIQDGKPPTVSILTIWVSQKLTHTLHRDAQDALQRETRGVRTQLEVRMRSQGEHGGDYIYEEALKIDTNAPRTITHKVEGENNQTIFVEEAPDLSNIFEQEEFALARDIVRVRRRRSADRYARIFDYLVEGRSKEETAVLEGVSELRAAHLFQRVRDDLRQAPVMIQVALKVLQVISDEPYSTAQEVEEEVSTEEVLLQEALQLLVLRGLATENKGSCYAPTNAGRTALELRSLT